MPKKDDKLDIDTDIVPEEEESSRIRGKSDSKLRKELKVCLAERQEYLEGWQRAKADLINFKRGNEEDRRRFAKFATQDLIESLLPVLDSFDAAIAHLSTQENSAGNGIEQIYKQLLGTLKQNGLEQTHPAGERFDPTRHESVGSVAVENKQDDGSIVNIVQKGYTLHDKIIRPAKVKVGEYEQ